MLWKGSVIMFRQKEPRQMRSFRLDKISAERLKSLSGQLGASQAELLEELINACYDSSCVDFDVKGFEKFVERCKEIQEELQARKEFGELLSEVQEQSVRNGTDEITMEEIDAEIAAYRKEKKAAAV